MQRGGVESMTYSRSVLCDHHMGRVRRGHVFDAVIAERRRVDAGE